MADPISFVKIPRELLPNKKTSPFYGHPNLMFVFLIILPKIRFGENGEFETHWGNVEIKPREFILNKKQLVWESGLTKTTVHKCILKLIKLEIIERVVVTLPGDPTRGPSQAPLYALTHKYYDLIYNCTVTLPGDPTRGPLKKKVFKKENIKKLRLNYIPPPSGEGIEIPSDKIIIEMPSQTNEVALQSIETPPSHIVMSVAEEWLREANIRFPWKSFNKAQFVQSLIKVQQKTGLNDEGIRKLYEAYKCSNFWQGKILPTTLLNKCKDGFTKCDHLLRTMNERDATNKLAKVERQTDDPEVLALRERTKKLMGM